VVEDSAAEAARFVRTYEYALAQGRVTDVSETRRSFAINAAGIAGVVELGDNDLPAVSSL